MMAHIRQANDNDIKPRIPGLLDGARESSATTARTPELNSEQPGSKAPKCTVESRRRTIGYCTNLDGERTTVLQLQDPDQENAWKLCYTLMELTLNREKEFLGPNQQTRRACWQLCQQLYHLRDVQTRVALNSIIKRCRDFCRTLFDALPPGDETLLRVSFDLHEQMFENGNPGSVQINGGPILRSLTEFCRRLMHRWKNYKSGVDAQMWACWSFVEMLLHARQSHTVRGLNEQSDYPVDQRYLDWHRAFDDMCLGS